MCRIRKFIIGFLCFSLGAAIVYGVVSAISICPSENDLILRSKAAIARNAEIAKTFTSAHVVAVKFNGDARGNLSVEAVNVDNAGEYQYMVMPGRIYAGERSMWVDKTRIFNDAQKGSMSISYSSTKGFVEAIVHVRDEYRSGQGWVLPASKE